MKNCLRNVLFGSVVVVIVIASQTFAADDKVRFRGVSDERQLFPDDFGVSSVLDLERTMQQPSRRGAGIVSDQPRETHSGRCS
mgnify:CR=1 FL=1|jgi:hypothetical protein